MEFFVSPDDGAHDRQEGRLEEENKSTVIVERKKRKLLMAFFVCVLYT